MSEGPFSSLNLARNVGDDAAAVQENHRLLADEVGYLPERLYELSQVHGAQVERAEGREAAREFRVREGDALLGCQRDLAIAVRVADCVPLLVAHPASGAVAAIHAGWRGVVAGVVSAGLLQLCREVDAEACELVCAIGPHIGPESFEVGDDVARQIAASASEDPRVVLSREPRPHIHLERAVRAQLTRLGVAASNIDRVPGCTFLERERFFSFRRDGSRSGRHLAVIVAGC